MQNRWECYHTSAENEAPKLRRHAQNASSVKEQAQAVKSRYEEADAGRDFAGGRTAAEGSTLWGGPDQAR